MDFSGKNSFRQLQIIGLTANNTFLEQEYLTWTSVGTVQHAAVADALVLTGATWETAVQYAQPRRGHGVNPTDQQSAVHTIKTDYFQPYTAVTCVSNPIEGANDQRPISIPIPVLKSDYESLPTGFNGELAVPAVEYSSIKRSQLLNLPGLGSSYRAQWIDVPRSLFNTSALGVAIVFPQASNDTLNNTTGGNLTQEMVVCNLGAGWGSSSMNTTSYLESISATSSLISFDTSNAFSSHNPQNFNYSRNTPIISYYQQIIDSPVFYLLPSFPERQIEINASWGQYLNPLIPSLNRTVLDHLLTANGNGPWASEGTENANSNTYAVQVTLTGLLTNALARVGYDYQFQGTPRYTSGPDNSTELDGTYWIYNNGDFFTVDPDQSRDWLKLKVVSTIEGYAYNLRSASPKVAVVFLLIYCLLALVSTVYAGISGKYSEIEILETERVILRVYRHQLDGMGLRLGSHSPGY